MADKHTAADYFVAGAKDFGNDMSNAFNAMIGNERLKGTSFENRKKLIDEDRDNYNPSFDKREVGLEGDK